MSEPAASWACWQCLCKKKTLFPSSGKFCTFLVAFFFKLKNENKEPSFYQEWKTKGQLLRLTSLSSQGSLQHYALVLQILEGHLNLVQPPLDGLLPTETRKNKEYIQPSTCSAMAIQYVYIPSFIHNIFSVSGRVRHSHTKTGFTGSAACTWFSYCF